MKKTIAILLVLIIAGTSLFATEGNKTIVIKAPVDAFTVFGVSENKVNFENFKSKALFDKALHKTVTANIDMLALDSDVSIGYLSGINNTKSAVSLYVTTTPLVSGDNTVAISVVENYFKIPPAADNRYGILNNSLLKIKEKTPGASAFAPAGDYQATVTISLTSGS